MKKHGFEIEDYNLPASVRKRIDDLVDLNINPSTINLITAEFSKSSEETKENIGRYIARLLEIEDFILQEEYRKSREINAGINLKQEMNIKNRQTNLLRIQQIFLKKDQENDKQNRVNKRAQEVSSSPDALINFKEAMVIKNQVQVSETEKLQELANKRRKLELAILEEQQKIKTAQKQYHRAKLEDDNITQELKLNIVKFANQRLQEISDAIATYKTVDKIPDEIIDNKSKCKDFLNSKDKTNFEKLQEDIKNLNEKKTKGNVSQTLEIDLETFFDVPGFDDYEEYEAVAAELFQRPKQENNKKKQKNKQIQKKQEVKKVEQKKVEVKKTEPKKVEQPKQKDTKKNSQTIEKKVEVKKPIAKSDESEKIIKKIKKKARAKDRQIDKITKEKEEIKKELIKLKEEKKINELRELENKKKKLNENFEETVKKEKRKIETTYQILEKKWKAETINQSLNSKQKAFNAVKTIKEKSKTVEQEPKKVEQPKVIEKPKTVEQPKVVEQAKVIEKPKPVEQPKVVEQAKVIEKPKPTQEIKQEKISFSNKKNISAEVQNQNKFEEDEKRIAYLERKKALNMITKEELGELEFKKKKNNHTSNKVDLRKFKLVNKYSQ